MLWDHVLSETLFYIWRLCSIVLFSDVSRSLFMVESVYYMHSWYTSTFVVSFCFMVGAHVLAVSFCFILGAHVIVVSLYFILGAHLLVVSLYILLGAHALAVSLYIMFGAHLRIYPLSLRLCHREALAEGWYDLTLHE